jgi:hypothetical protein
MATDLTVVLRDEPGALARLGEATVSAGVRLRGLAAFTGDGCGFVHALVEDGDVARAKDALKRAGLKVADTREVVVAALGAGGLEDAMRALAAANVNVDLAYTADGGRLVVATDDVHNAREALA